jgi:hypothetical protein
LARLPLYMILFSCISPPLPAAACDQVSVQVDRSCCLYLFSLRKIPFRCFDLASLSEDIVKVWSIASDTCIHEIRSHGNQYQSRNSMLIGPNFPWPTCFSFPVSSPLPTLAGTATHFPLCQLATYLFR